MSHAIDSLLAGGDDMEIIIVNDGSTDNSETIINKYLHNYSNKVKYLTKKFYDF